VQLKPHAAPLAVIEFTIIPFLLPFPFSVLNPPPPPHRQSRRSGFRRFGFRRSSALHHSVTLRCYPTVPENLEPGSQNYYNLPVILYGLRTALLCLPEPSIIYSALAIFLSLVISPHLSFHPPPVPLHFPSPTNSPIPFLRPFFPVVFSFFCSGPVPCLHHPPALLF